MPNAKGIPYIGLSNLRQEIKAIVERVVENVPFNVKEYLKFNVPGSDSVGDWGR